MPSVVIDLSNLAASDGFIVQGDAELDQAGRSVSAAGDVNGDGIDDFIVGASNGDDGGDNAGEAYVIYGKLGSTRGTLDLTNLASSDGFIIQGDAARDQAGFSVSSAGDVNGDGIDDLILGANAGDDGGYNAGEAYVIYGKSGSTRGTLDLTGLAASDGFIIQGDVAGDIAGVSVSGAGDVNGDGIDDVIVGAWGGDDGGTEAGEAYVIYGRAGATRGTLDLTALAAADGFVIQGDTEGDRAGVSVSSAGDVNGDGIDDLIVGASRGDNGGTDAGEAYVIYGKSGSTRGTLDLTGLAASDGFIIQGDAAGDYAGVSVSSAGDVNGDGLDDLIVGASRGDDGGIEAGEAYVIYGQSGSMRATLDLTGLTASDGFIIQGDAARDNAGFSVSGAGDVNGDGIDDLIVGAFGGDDGGSSAGEAYVIYGKFGITRGRLDLTNLAASDGFIIQGDNAGDQAGFSVSGAGDVNGDGIDDLIVGANGGDNGGNAAGEAYVIYGSRSFGVIAATAGNDTLDGTGGPDTIDGLDGDDILNGGGGNDALIGGLGNDQLNGDAGDDSMAGGAGNDSYSVASVGDTVVEAADEGADYVKTTLASYTLTDNIEVLSYRGVGDFTGVGNALDNGIYGGNQADTVSGLDGNDTLSTDAGTDELNGGEGNDRLFGGTGTDIMNGDAGDDELYVDDAGDVANGGTGIDTVLISGSLSYTVADDIENVTVNAAGVTDVTLNALDNIYGAGFGGGTASGGDGADKMVGRSGVDILNGDGGNDLLLGYEGNDVLSGGADNDNLDGDAGIDTLNGGSGTDTLRGGADNDILNGGDDDDVLIGNTGADAMDGGAGNDLFFVDDAFDMVAGGDGIDFVNLIGVTSFTAADDIEIVDAISAGLNYAITLGANDSIFGASSTGGTATGGAGEDSFFGRGGDDIFSGGTGNDRLNGYAGNDLLFGDEDNDVLEGGDGQDQLLGGTGDDTLYGGADFDLIFGDAGVDYMSGGSGTDFFIFLSALDSGAQGAAADRIVDFDGAQGDRIDLNGIDADSTTIGSNDAFSFIGAAAFSNTAGEVRYEQIGGNTFVQGDVDGDGIADFVIQLDGLLAPVGSDFIL